MGFRRGEPLRFTCTKLSAEPVLLQICKIGEIGETPSRRISAAGHSGAPVARGNVAAVEEIEIASKIETPLVGLLL